MTGYHANDRERCERFIKEKSYIIDSDKDTDYLGKGMYFWDDPVQAEWWLKTKHKESIVSAELDLSAMLDLTQKTIADKMECLYEKIPKAVTEKYRMKYGNLEGLLGIRLNILYECYAQMNNFAVVKAQKHYDLKPESDFLKGTPLTSKTVSIYCVKTELPIGERSWYKNDK